MRNGIFRPGIFRLCGLHHHGKNMSSAKCEHRGSRSACASAVWSRPSVSLTELLDTLECINVVQSPDETRMRRMLRLRTFCACSKAPFRLTKDQIILFISPVGLRSLIFVDVRPPYWAFAVRISSEGLYIRRHL